MCLNDFIISSYKGILLSDKKVVDLFLNIIKRFKIKYYKNILNQFLPNLIYTFQQYFRENEK